MVELWLNMLSHSISFLRWPGLAIFMLDRMIITLALSWQVTTLGVLLQWYHMHLHLSKSHPTSYNYVVCGCLYLLLMIVG